MDSSFSVLHAMEGQTVNVDELYYLAKRLESFDDGEAKQFQAMAHKLDLTDIKDFINLTFCCQQATVISDLSKLERAGKQHLMNLNGGSLPVDEWNHADGQVIAEELLRSGAGSLTPYGIVFDNGMKLEELYKGQAFPPYSYEAGPMSVIVSAKDDPEKSLWLELPMPDSQIDRALERAGISQTADLSIAVDWSEIPADFIILLHVGLAALRELNGMCVAIHELNDGQTKRLWKAMEYAQPKCAAQVQRLAENIDLFDFIPGVQNTAQLGSYMIRESGRFEYDPNLDSFYDFEGYGRQMLECQNSKFVKEGYIGYCGTQPLEELLEVSAMEQGPQTGWMQMLSRVELFFEIIQRHLDKKETPCILICTFYCMKTLRC